MFPQYLALYAKIFLIISNIYSLAFGIQGSVLKNTNTDERIMRTFFSQDSE